MSDLTKLITERIDNYRTYVNYLVELPWLISEIVTSTQLTCSRMMVESLDTNGNKELIKFVDEDISSAVIGVDDSISCKSTRTVTGDRWYIQNEEIRSTGICYNTYCISELYMFTILIVYRN